MAPGGRSLYGAENDCVLTCSDGFKGAEGTEAESSVSRQLLAGLHGASCRYNFTGMNSQQGSLCGRRLLLLAANWRLRCGSNSAGSCCPSSQLNSASDPPPIWQKANLACLCRLPTQGPVLLQASNDPPDHACTDAPASSHLQPVVAIVLPADRPQERLVLPQAKPGTTTSHESLIHPPFDISNGNQHWALSSWGAGVTASHANGLLEYDVHNLYGLSEAVATNAAMQMITGNKPFLLSR